MSLLSIFDKPKPFDLAAFLESWPDAPRFTGKRKVDPPVASWLDAVHAGLVERKVPEKHHVPVARALLGEKALLRLEEFERVLVSMKGGEYKWDWDKFKLAMTSLGWEISKKKTSPFTIAAKRSGRWWVIGKKDETSAPSEKEGNPSEFLASTKSFFKMKRRDSTASFASSKGAVMDEPEPMVSEKAKVQDDFVVVTSPAAVAPTGLPPRRTPIRAMSDTFVAALRNPLPSADAPSQEPKESKALVKAAVAAPPAPKRSNTEPITTTTAVAPLWLVNASTALDFLTAEYPRTVSALSAILLAAGSIPAIAATGGAAAPALAPAIHAITAAGGGGIVAALGSSTAVAIGAVATGLGSWLKSQNVEPVPPQAPAVQAK